MFRYIIDAYSATRTGAQLEGRGETSPILSDFGKKGDDCVNLWVKLSIQNVLLRIPRRKNFKMFPVGPFLFVVLMKCLSKCPSSTTPPLFLPPPPPASNFLQNVPS